MNISSLVNTYSEKYFGWRRALAHVLFWIFIFSYEAVQTSFTIERTDILIFFTLREVATIMLIHYFLAYYAIPTFLLRYRWLYFILCVLASYVVLMGGMYFSLCYLEAHHLVTDYLTQTAAFFLKYDFLTTLISPDRIYNVVGFNLSLVISLLIKMKRFKVLVA